MENKLKVLMLNGSPRANGNIALAFREMEQVFEELGVEYENIQVGHRIYLKNRPYQVHLPIQS